MTGGDKPAPHEIVLVRRRRGGHDDAGHGGAWKIAFADFMTALMCFFLVMWLINSTDNKTITQIANYFNPLRLNDRAPSTKGVHEPDVKRPAPERKEASNDSAGRVAKPGKNAPSGQERTADAPAGGASLETDDPLQDPFGTLERIASSAPRSGHPPLPALPKDAFDRSPAPKQAVAPGPGSSGSDRSALAAEIEHKINQALDEAGLAFRPGIEVRQEGEELMVSVADESDFGMFALASARPTRELVTVLERIGKVLSGISGAIAIRGHTDGRQFRGGANDNWRLSMARAQMAYYMLVRGGLAEQRVRQLEGRADRDLKVRDDPLAAPNRRIEVIVRGQHP